MRCSPRLLNMDDKDFNLVAFEESLSDDWSRDLGVREVPLKSKSLLFLGAIIFLIGAVLGGRLLYLGVSKGEVYAKRANLNLNRVDHIPAPRGEILDRNGIVLADNRAVFSAKLDVKEFLYKPDEQNQILAGVEKILGLKPEDVWALINDKNTELDIRVEPVILSEDLGQTELLALKSAKLPTIKIEENYKRAYTQGNAFSSVLGYVGLVTGKDLAENPKLTGEDYVGKSGLEAFYDEKLLGSPGVVTELRNAKGEMIGPGENTPAKIGAPLKTTIDAEFQKYFFNRMQSGLKSLGRTTGVGMAFNPKTGEVLSLINLPSFDNNAFHEAGRSAERTELLTSSLRPLFDRAVGGTYTPGSTIKPLVGVAALAEGVVTPEKSVFSPGYLDVPNPYDPSKPSRFLDWRYQGTINLYSAIAQSSNVYFYAVGGGAFDIKGLGISRLRDWWAKFGLGEKTGIDLPGEATGFLPSADWKESSGRGSWLLGDTYNASIGQGDLQITPVQLLDYIAGVANDGKIMVPAISEAGVGKTRIDLSSLAPQIKEVQKGMRTTVTSVMGTAHLLNDLPVQVAAKTGSAQIQNNALENAFFVGYAPYDNPQVAILVLIEHAKEGSLNAVPIAKDVFAWYYEHRLRGR